MSYGLDKVLRWFHGRVTHGSHTLEPYTDESENFGRRVGRAVMYRIFEDIYTTFPDWHMEIKEIKAVGDTVMVWVLTSRRDSLDQVQGR